MHLAGRRCAWAGPLTRLNPSTPSLLIPPRQEGAGPPGRTRKEGGGGRGREAGREQATCAHKHRESPQNAPPWLVALRFVGSQGHRGAEVPSPEGCSQHPEKEPALCGGPAHGQRAWGAGPGPGHTVEKRRRGCSAGKRRGSTQRTAGRGVGPQCQGWRSVPEGGCCPPVAQPGQWGSG